MKVHDAVYVLLDPGVPAYGHKGSSVHVQSVLRELVARSTGRVTLVATRIGGEAPAGLESVEVVEMKLPKTSGVAEREQALIELDERTASLVADLVRERAAEASDATRPLVYQRYSLFSCQVLEQAAAAGAHTVLEVNAPLVEEQATHRELHAAQAATDMTVRALRAAGTAIAVSSGVARWAEGESGRPVHTVPNGVDLARYRVVTPRETARPVVAFVGGFRPWHDPDQLVRAAAELGRRGTPVELLLVGDGPCLQQVLDLAASCQVAVRSVGLVAPEQVPEYLAQADIAVAPYPKGEAYFSPLKVAEYLASGLPTVLSAVADLPDLLDPHEAHLVAPGDEPAFVDALGRLAANVGERARMGEAARAAAQRFTWSAVVDTILSLEQVQSIGVHGDG
ncbi:MAG: glycosyltransferase family 4 protein [Dermatophilus congolensis]|nr:glycosyltransferase family 4 protein [Dermatophilus congolensis]